jgi:hypothetical protein
MICDDYKFKDFSVLIQGPINDISLKNLDKYSEYGPVVVSTWASEEIISTVKKQDVKFIINQLPDKKDNPLYIKESTFYWAICSMYYGLKNVETKYVVKTRSDESFSELEPFINKFLQDPKKLVCGNCFVEKFEKKQFHIGDHIFVVNTQKILDAITEIKNVYEQKSKEKWWVHQGEFCAEQILAFGFLFYSGVELQKVKNGQPTEVEKQIFRDYFEIVDLNSISEFILKNNHKNKTYKNNFFNPLGVASMENAL